MKSQRNSKRPTISNTGMLGRLRYFINRAVINIRQNIFVNAVTVGTITLALLIASLFLLLVVNLENAADTWSERVQVTVYFDRDMTTQEQSEMKSRIQAISGTHKVSWVGREEAYKRFKGRLKGQETLLEGVKPDLLPTSFEISLKKDSRSNESVDGYVSRLKSVVGNGEIQYGQEWVRRFNTFLTFMRLVGGLVGIFLLLAVIFIVANTIRLTIYARREELEVMSLVGATRLFIKMPFLVEGFLQGLCGGIFSIIMLLAIYLIFLHNAGNFLTFNPAASGLAFLPSEYMVCILLSGAMLGFLGSLTSLRRFMSDL